MTLNLDVGSNCELLTIKTVWAEFREDPTIAVELVGVSHDLVLVSFQRTMTKHCLLLSISIVLLAKPWLQCHALLRGVHICSILCVKWHVKPEPQLTIQGSLHQDVWSTRESVNRSLHRMRPTIQQGMVLLLA